MMFDTDVLVWVFRGSVKGAEALEDDADRCFSVVSYLELLQGARHRDEVRRIKSFIADLGLQTVPLSENIGHRASIYMEEFGLKAGMRIADALIAATAAENHLTLCTANRRHFRVVSELPLKLFHL